MFWVYRQVFGKCLAFYDDGLKILDGFLVI